MTQAITVYSRIDEVIYCSMELLVELGLSYATIEMGYRRGANHWQSIQDPNDNRRRLIAYAPMKEKYKQLVKSKYGDPYAVIKQQFFEQMLCYDPLDAKLIDSFRTAKMEQLSLAKRKAYKKAAALLAYLADLPRLTKAVLKNLGFENAKAFWKAVYQFIKNQDIKLPASPRLKVKIGEYKEQGAAALIHDGYNNDNGKKFNERATKVLVKLMRDQHGRKFSGKEVWRQFKAVAKQHQLGEQFETITYQCIWQHIKATESLWYGERHGHKEAMLNRQIVINQRRPSQPHFQWQIDGTPSPLWFYDAMRKRLDKLYVVVVMDSYSNAIVGYSIGKTENMNMVFDAMKMAIKTQGVSPNELRSDNGSAMKGGETVELLRNLGINFKPSKVGRARARSIEAQQGEWMENAAQYFYSRSGANITARTMDSRQNADKTKQNYKSYPDEQELVGQLRESIALYNNWQRDGKPTRAEMLKEPAPLARKVDAYEVLDQFYVFRKKGKKYTPYHLKAEGWTMEVAKKEYRYLPQVASAAEMATFMNRHINLTKFYIKYDPSDLEQVGIYTLPNDAPEESAEYFRLLTWATIKGKAAQYQGDASDEEKEQYRYLREVQKEQEQQVKEALEAHEQDLQAHNILSGGIDIKTVRKDDYNAAKIELQRLAALGYGSTTLNQEQEQYLDVEVEEEEPIADAYDSDFDISSLLDFE